MWSLRPVIHPFYGDRNRQALLAVEEPLLSTSLETLSFRYHSHSAPQGEIRSEWIH